MECHRSNVEQKFLFKKSVFKDGLGAPRGLEVEAKGLGVPCADTLVRRAVLMSTPKVLR